MARKPRKNTQKRNEDQVVTTEATAPGAGEGTTTATATLRGDPTTVIQGAPPQLNPDVGPSALRPDLAPGMDPRLVGLPGIDRKGIDAQIAEHTQVSKDVLGETLTHHNGPGVDEMLGRAGAHLHGNPSIESMLRPEGKGAPPDLAHGHDPSVYGTTIGQGVTNLYDGKPWDGDPPKTGYEQGLADRAAKEGNTDLRTHQSNWDKQAEQVAKNQMAEQDRVAAKLAADLAAKEAKDAADKAAKEAKQAADKAAKEAKDAADKAAKEAKDAADKAAKEAKDKADKEAAAKKMTDPDADPGGSPVGAGTAPPVFKGDWVSHPVQGGGGEAPTLDPSQVPKGGVVPGVVDKNPEYEETVVSGAPRVPGSGFTDGVNPRDGITPVAPEGGSPAPHTGGDPQAMVGAAASAPVGFEAGSAPGAAVPAVAVATEVPQAIVANEAPTATVATEAPPAAPDAVAVSHVAPEATLATGGPPPGFDAGDQAPAPQLSADADHVGDFGGPPPGAESEDPGAQPGGLDDDDDG